MFPEGIYFEILLRLPVKSACVCKCVSKTWFSLISNPRFVKSHLNLTIQTKNSSLILNGLDTSRRRGDLCVIYSISHDSLPSFLSSDEEFLEYAVEMDYPFKSSLLCDSVRLVGCCHGLVCLLLRFVYSENGHFCLWNPATKEYKKLPNSPNANYSVYFSMIGLCYDSKNEDYKLVSSFDDNGVIEVYSLGLNSWTSIGKVPYVFFNIGEVGVLVNGDLHWLARTQDSSEVVVCLDISSHIFKEIQLPNKSDREMIVLGMLDGCLCVHFHVTDGQSEVWVMQDYGVEKSWTKRYVIKDERINEGFPMLLRSFKSGEMLFWLTESDDLAIYDPKDETVREPSIPSLMQFQQEGCYYESLVSLRSGTYVGAEEEEEQKEEEEQEQEQEEEDDEEDRT